MFPRRGRCLSSKIKVISLESPARSSVGAFVEGTPMVGSHLSVQGLRTRVDVQGDGPALLLVNGIWGEVAAWRPLLPYFAGYRTIAFDAPGIGDTEIPS